MFEFSDEWKDESMENIEEIGLNETKVLHVFYSKGMKLYLVGSWVKNVNIKESSVEDPKK